MTITEQTRAALEAFEHFDATPNGLPMEGRVPGAAPWYGHSNGAALVAYHAEPKPDEQEFPSSFIGGVIHGVLKADVARSVTRAELLSFLPPVPRPVTDCPECHGDGETECRACEGEGTIQDECDECGQDTSKNCFDCEGDGAVSCAKGCPSPIRRTPIVSGAFGDCVVNLKLFAVTVAACPFEDDIPAELVLMKDRVALRGADWLAVVMCLSDEATETMPRFPVAA